jgi:isopropylmalate/homocitrate/citramalate synthase
LDTGIDTTQLTRTMQARQHCDWHQRSANMAIVGAIAFAHESGIHQEGC